MTDEEFIQIKKEGERIRHEHERRMVAVLVASSIFQEVLDYIKSDQHGGLADGACVCDSSEREILREDGVMVCGFCFQPRQ